MLAIFGGMVKSTMEVFMDDFSMFGDSFGLCMKNFNRVLMRYEETNLVLSWEKFYYTVQEEIFTGITFLRRG